MNKLIISGILFAALAHLGLSAAPAHEEAARRSYEYFCTGDEATRREHAVANIVNISEEQKERIIAQRAATCKRMEAHFGKAQ